MKKWFFITLGIFIVLLVSCQKEIQDVVPPTILGVKDLTYIIGKPEPNYLAGITAKDNMDGDITYLIEVDTSEVDLTKAGIYAITYLVSDLSNNQSKEDCVIIVLATHTP